MVRNSSPDKVTNYVLTSIGGVLSSIVAGTTQPEFLPFTIGAMIAVLIVVHVSGAELSRILKYVLYVVTLIIVLIFLLFALGLYALWRLFH